MKLLNEIQQKLKVPKGQYNSFSKYHYRNAEDILEAVKPLLGEGRLIISDEIVLIGDRYYVKATAALHDEEGVAVATAYAREASEKKGMDEAQITGAASSYARKYALNGLFLIDDTKDADNADNRVTEPKKLSSAVKETIAEEVVKDDVPFENDEPAIQVEAKFQRTPTEKKLRIKKLLDSKALTDLKTKQEYEEYCEFLTNLKLVTENYDEVIKKLT